MPPTAGGEGRPRDPSPGQPTASGAGRGAGRTPGLLEADSPPATSLTRASSRPDGGGAGRGSDDAKPARGGRSGRRRPAGQHRSKHEVLLVRCSGARVGRDRGEADDDRVVAYAALENGGVELSQLDGLSDGRRDVKARSRGTGRGTPAAAMAMATGSAEGGPAMAAHGEGVRKDSAAFDAMGGGPADVGTGRRETGTKADAEEGPGRADANTHD